MTRISYGVSNGLNDDEWNELVALKKAINYNPHQVHYSKMERFSELMVKTLPYRDNTSCDI